MHIRNGNGLQLIQPRQVIAKGEGKGEIYRESHKRNLLAICTDMMAAQRKLRQLPHRRSRGARRRGLALRAGAGAVRRPARRAGPRPRPYRSQALPAEGPVAGEVPDRDDPARVVRAPQPAGFLLGGTGSARQAARGEGVQGPAAPRAGGGDRGAAKAARRSGDALAHKLRRQTISPSSHVVILLVHSMYQPLERITIIVHDENDRI